jgi:hypothetical protein
LRKHGVIPEKPPSPTPMIEEAILEARRLAHENRLEGKDLDELDELEDDEDEAFLDQYRFVEREIMIFHGRESNNLVERSVWTSLRPYKPPAYTTKYIPYRNRNIRKRSQKHRIKLLSWCFSQAQAVRMKSQGF